MQVELVVLVLAALAAAVSAYSWWGIRRARAGPSDTASSAAAPPPLSGTQRVALVLNPVKLHAALTREQVEQACADSGWEPPLILETTVEDPGFGQASRALEEGYDVVLAAGGDGTVRAVAQALAHSSASLGLVPLGTGNLLARNLGIAVNDIPQSIRQALHGSERRIDIGWISLLNERTGVSSQHAFLVVGGIGLDATVVAATKDSLKEKFGWLAYSEAGMRHLPGRRQRVSISLDGRPAQSRKVRSVLFANCAKLPGGIEFIPDSTIDDGYLDVVVMSPRSVLGWLWMAGKIVFRQRRAIPVLTYYRARKVTVTVLEPTQTQIDGDLSGAVTTVAVEVDPGALMVRVLGETTGPSAGLFSHSAES